MRKLTLKNYFLISDIPGKVESIQGWLAKQMLHGKVSRARTRFLRHITDGVNEIDSERQKLLDQHASKNEQGEIIFFDKDNKETVKKEDGARYKIKDESKFQKEYWDYLKEDYVVDVTPATSEAIYGVRDLILDTKEEFTGKMATIYDEWCDAFESISKDAGQKETQYSTYEEEKVLQGKIVEGK